MKNKFIKPLQILLILGLLFFLKNINFDNFIERFNTSFVTAIIVAQIPILIALLLASYRHLYFVDDKRLKFSVALSAFIIGTGYNYILPARISELLKATYIKEKSQIPLSIGVGAVFLERLNDMIIISFLGLVSILFFALDLNIYLALSIFTTSLAFIVGVVLFKDHILYLAEKIIRWEGLQQFLSKVLIQISTQVSSKRFLIGLLLGASIWGFSILVVGTFMNIAGDFEFGVIATITLLIGGAIGLAIPALPGGLGTFEAVAVAVMMKYGYDFDSSMALAIGMRISNMILIVPAALAISVINGTGLYSTITNFKKGINQNDK